MTEWICYVDMFIINDIRSCNERTTLHCVESSAFANLHINNFYLHTSSIVIDRYSNFGNPYLSKEFTRVLVPGQIVTSLSTIFQLYAGGCLIALITFHFQENFEYVNGVTNAYYKHPFMLNISSFSQNHFLCEKWGYLFSTFGRPSIPPARTQTNARIPCPHKFKML
jgi:hypothetical protein